MHIILSLLVPNYFGCLRGSKLKLIPWTFFSCRTFLAGRVWSTKLTTREESDWNELLPPPTVLPPLPNAPEKKTIYPVELKTSKWAKEIEKLKNLQKFSVSAICDTPTYSRCTDHWKTKVTTVYNTYICTCYRVGDRFVLLADTSDNSTL